MLSAQLVKPQTSTTLSSQNRICASGVRRFRFAVAMIRSKRASSSGRTNGIVIFLMPFMVNSPSCALKSGRWDSFFNSSKFRFSLAFFFSRCLPGACYTLDFIRQSSADKVYPALQGDWEYSDATRKAGYRYLPDRRAFQLFGAVKGGTGLILYTPARLGSGTVYRIATTANRAYCGLYVDENGGLYHEDGNTTDVSLDGLVLMTD